MAHREPIEIARTLATIVVVMCAMLNARSIWVFRGLTVGLGQEGPTGFMRFLSVHISFLLRHRKIIGITIVHHRWFPTWIFSQR